MLLLPRMVEHPIIWDTSDNVTIAGDLTVTGNDIGGSSWDCYNIQRS